MTLLRYANLQKMADTCGYELPTNLQNFTQKHLTKVKIFQKVLLFLKHPVDSPACRRVHSRAHME